MITVNDYGTFDLILYKYHVHILSNSIALVTDYSLVYVDYLLTDKMILFTFGH